MKMQVVFVILVLSGLISVKTTSAAKHMIGDSQGWEASVDLDSWASGRSFKVGDQLVFKYSALHSVVELGSETEYKSCDLGTPVNSWSSGNDAVKLPKAGTRYFVCGTPGHCQQGMKVKVNVASSDSTTVSTPGSGSGSDSDTDTGSSPSKNSDTGSGHGLGASIGYILAVGLFTIGLRLM